MTYVALLRGVNVGGKALISMAALKETFEQLGLEQVRTYINSGNIIFAANEQDKRKLVAMLERAIEKEHQLAVKVLLRTHEEMKQLATAIPDAWFSDQSLRCYILFLWPEVDRPEIVNEIPWREGIEEIRYTPGAVLHKTAKKDITKGKLNQLAGTPFYKQITIRNSNTVRKLLELMEQSS